MNTMDRAAYLAQIDQVNREGTYQPNWDSLAQYTVPAWYADMKFGIFLHWGVFSVPAFGSEWYSRNMYIQGSPEFEHHVKTYGPHKQFGYKDFIPMFTMEKFDPQAWRPYSGKPARSMWCQWQSITMGSNCMLLSFHNGTLRKWDRTGMCWEIC